MANRTVVYECDVTAYFVRIIYVSFASTSSFLFKIFSFQNLGVWWRTCTCSGMKMTMTSFITSPLFCCIPPQMWKTKENAPASCARSDLNRKAAGNPEQARENRQKQKSRKVWAQTTAEFFKALFLCHKRKAVHRGERTMNLPGWTFCLCFMVCFAVS